MEVTDTEVTAAQQRGQDWQGRQQGRRLGKEETEEEDKRSEEMRRWGEARDGVFTRQTVRSAGGRRQPSGSSRVPQRRPHTALLKASARHLWCLWKQKGQCPQHLLQGDPRGQASGGGLELSLAGEGTALRHARGPVTQPRPEDVMTSGCSLDSGKKTQAVSELSHLVTNGRTWWPRWE